MAVFKTDAPQITTVARCVRVKGVASIFKKNFILKCTEQRARSSGTARTKRHVGDTCPPRARAPGAAASYEIGPYKKGPKFDDSSDVSHNRQGHSLRIGLKHSKPCFEKIDGDQRGKRDMQRPYHVEIYSLPTLLGSRPFARSCVHVDRE
ncbi:hypothetical protein EVAR_9915_1 [Eumeta japonica]|uniref:Uncharacterized protein n=1 Tax=Eumeta variegata TaxID=151549 RepID=A0A4C1TQH3_EUMVA|nr:hypothetical protein EVAR_9915_1 [Eumeta japonica]